MGHYRRQHDDQRRLLLPDHVPEVDTGGGERTLGGDVAVDDPRPGDLHHHVVGVDVVPGGAVGQDNAGRVVRGDVLVTVLGGVLGQVTLTRIEEVR